MGKKKCGSGNKSQLTNYFSKIQIKKAINF